MDRDSWRFQPLIMRLHDSTPEPFHQTPLHNRRLFHTKAIILQLLYFKMDVDSCKLHSANCIRILQHYYNIAILGLSLHCSEPNKVGTIFLPVGAFFHRCFVILTLQINIVWLFVEAGH